MFFDIFSKFEVSSKCRTVEKKFFAFQSRRMQSKRISKQHFLKNGNFFAFFVYNFELTVTSNFKLQYFCKDEKRDNKISNIINLSIPLQYIINLQSINHCVY